jgi:hypothetical protein
MLHVLLTALCAVGVVFWLICIHGLIGDLREHKSKNLIGDLTPQSRKHS